MTATSAGPTGTSVTSLRLGFLHVGRPESGVRRYGRILADAAAERPDVTLVEADAGLLEGRRGGLGERGRELIGADAVVMQWNRRGWGRGPRSVRRYVDFRRAYRGPVVVTLHDVFDRVGMRERWVRADVWSLRLLARTVDRIVVHSEAEVERLRGIVPRDKLRVIPHFVESRALPTDPDAARAALGVGGRRVITLLGFIYGRKGYKVAVETLPTLPEDVVLVFAGGPVAGREGTLRIVRERAAAMGMGDRLRITGYLSEEELEMWMAATDLAILPFLDVSASGSLSSWIAAARPILVSDLPGFHEYDALVPGALHIFRPTEPAALAAAMCELLAAGLPAVDPRVAELRDQLTVARTVERYLEVARELV